MTPAARPPNILQACAFDAPDRTSSQYRVSPAQSPPPLRRGEGQGSPVGDEPGLPDPVPAPLLQPGFFGSQLLFPP